MEKNKAQTHSTVPPDNSMKVHSNVIPLSNICPYFHMRTLMWDFRRLHNLSINLQLIIEAPSIPTQVSPGTRIIPLHDLIGAVACLTEQAISDELQYTSQLWKYKDQQIWFVSSLRN